MNRKPRLFYGWYVLAASFVILFLNAGGRFIIGVMVKPMAADFGWSRSAVSSAIFLNLAVYALAVVFVGRLYDRYGPKWVIAGSTILFSAGYALMATMDSLWQFLLFFGVLSGAGLGGTTVPIFGAIIGNWFEKRRGMAVSLAMAGSCLGQFVLVPVFSEMIDISGWRSTSLWIAIICLVANLILVFGVIRGDPERFGLRAYGRDERSQVLSEMPAAAGVPRAPAGPRDLTLSEAMRTRSLWLFTLAMFVCGSADFFLTTHLVPMVTDYGISAADGASMLAWFGLMGLFGVLLAGPAADAIGNKIPIAVTFGLRVVLFVMVFFLQGAVPFWLLALGFGLTVLVTAPLTTTLVAALYGVTHIGFISGFINTVHMVGGGLWSYLGGVIYDSSGDYRPAFVTMAAMSAAAFACTLLIREKRHLPTARS
ncbi:MAG: MFS transporter [Thermoleophilia bacterium]|nr:MFS transporter [Thermoleophilia bacterium]